MLRSVFVIVGAAALVVGTAGWSPRLAEAPRAGRLIVVKAVDVSATEYKFAPGTVTVQPGDTVRFEQTAASPHNVEFKEVPAGAKLGEAMSGPYLLAPGQTYDLVIDSRFASGTYSYVCTPHEAFGMKATLTISAGK